jgi:NADP-dependent 3-hydroxy acid dehydrogenase YdfG
MTPSRTQSSRNLRAVDRSRGSELNLDGAVSIVTGASGGIGSATALALAERGSRIVITGRRIARLAALERAVVQRGGEARVVDGDIASAATARAVVDATIERYGRVDILVNSAGYGPPMPLVELSEEVWDATVDSCLKGAYLMARAVLPLMLAAGSGQIAQVSSTAGKGVEADRTAYCAAQWGLQGFFLALQAELRDTNVRVHVVNPASVATDWWTTTDDPQPASALGRMLSPDDVADAIVWMLTRPDHLFIGELVVHHSRNPWGPG